ncbi:MAG: hypothetical protein WD278_04890, partial [Pirellulales bacterium]
MARLVRPVGKAGFFVPPAFLLPPVQISGKKARFSEQRCLWLSGAIVRVPLLCSPVSSGRPREPFTIDESTGPPN